MNIIWKKKKRKKEMIKPTENEEDGFRFMLDEYYMEERGNDTYG